MTLFYLLLSADILTDMEMLIRSLTMMSADSNASVFDVGSLFFTRLLARIDQRILEIGAANSIHGFLGH